MAAISHRLRVGLAFAFIALIAVLAFGCGDSSDDAPAPTATIRSTPDGAEQTYLDEILAIDTLIGAVVVITEASLEGTYATRGRLFSLLDDADVIGTFATMLTRAEALEPPAGYADDHELYLGSLRESVALARELQTALEAEDLVQFDVKTVQLFVSRAHLLLDTSPSFCDAALRSDVTPGCPPTEPILGGAYGQQLHALFRSFLADFSPRVGAFPPAMTEDEILEELAILQPPIIAAIEAASNDLKAIDPPSEFERDHELLETYFEDTLNLSLAISQAVEDGNSASQVFEFNRSGVVQCEAATALSPEMLQITRFFDQTLC